jgi:hypothetical protein
MKLFMLGLILLNSSLVLADNLDCSVYVYDEATDFVADKEADASFTVNYYEQKIGQKYKAGDLYYKFVKRSERVKFGDDYSDTVYIPQVRITVGVSSTGVRTSQRAFASGDKIKHSFIVAAKNGSTKIQYDLVCKNLLFNPLRFKN